MLGLRRKMLQEICHHLTVAFFPAPFFSNHVILPAFFIRRILIRWQVTIWPTMSLPAWCTVTKIFNRRSRSRLLIQYWSLLNWRKIRFRYSSVAVHVKWNCVVISQCFAIFKNVVHSLEPGETPNIANYFKTLRCGAVAFIFSIYLKPVLF